jgi:hypothetical protein
MKHLLILLFFVQVHFLNAQEQRGTISVKKAVVEFPDVMPEFPQGDAAFMQYLQSKLVVPKDVKLKGGNATCYVSFIVGADGFIYDTRIVSGVNGCPQCDKEALLAFEDMPRWIAGEKDGKRVDVRCTVPVKFNR